MPEITLVAEAGRPTGSRPASRLRAAGRVPAVVYGHGMDPLPVAVDARELRAALNTEAGVNVVLQLEVAGERHLAMPRVLQRHPVRNNVIHVDFQVVRADEEVTAEVPIVLVGEAVEVTRAGGVLDHALLALTVSARPGSIPNNLEVDVSGLAVGDAVRVGDLSLPRGVTTAVDAEQPVVVAQSPASTAAAEAEEAEAGATPAGEGEGGGGGGGAEGGEG
jgi:large subunit ribosomal protein L25